MLRTLIESVICVKKHVQDAPFKIYSASAGSGKTYTLAKEYLKIALSSRIGYRQILAITFTNKAVNEMKYRILNSLYNFSQTSVPAEAQTMFDEICTELQIDTSILKQRAGQTLKSILHNYAFFDVSTIDKFTHRLIRTFARDLKLPQNFEVVLDTDLLMDEAVSRLIDKAGSDEKLTRILIDFALEKIDDSKSWDVAYDLNQIGKLLFNENHAPHIKKLEDKGLDDFLGIRRHIRSRIDDASEGLTSDASKSLKLIEENGLDFSDFTASYFPKFMVKIQAGEFNIDFNAAWKQNFETKPLYNKSCAEGTKSVLDELHPELIILFNKLKTGHRELSFLNNVYGNLVPLTVLNAIQQEVKAIQSDRDQLSISEFNTLISKEIKDQPAPFIYERLGEKYRHYFIDEFQDTSGMQWNNLMPLVSNALESEDVNGERGTLFLVGDAKQAIYRWRGGRAEQFLNLVNSATNPFVVPPTIAPLPKNYRSYSEIVAFNNDFFSSTSPFLNNEIYETLFIEGNKQAHTEKQGGVVEITFIAPSEENPKDGLYCTEVLKTIETVRKKKYRLEDITILVRDNKHGILLADFLTQMGIGVISSDSLLIQSSPEVRFLIDLLHFSVQPDDLESSYSLLNYLSPTEKQKHEFIHKNLREVSKFLLNEYQFDLQKFKKNSVYDGLEYAIRLFKLANHSDAYLSFFMDTVFEVEQKEGAGARTFLSYWEKKKDRLGIIAPENVDAVRIMSIHKAKGLEFRIVIFPYANAYIYKEINPKLWLPVNAKSFMGFDEVLLNKKQEVLNYGPEAAEIYDDEQHRLELDAYNVLYVALTRAIQGLYIITEKDVLKNGEPKLDYYSGLFIHYLKEIGLWQEDRKSYSFGSLVDLEGVGAISPQEPISYGYSFKERPSFKILAQSENLWDSTTESARIRGNLIHYILGLLESVEDVPKAIMTLKKNGDVAPDEIEYVTTKINEVVEHPILAKYYAKNNEVLNERGILTKEGTLLRPDRIILNGRSATLIDYKTGKKNPKYHEQLYFYSDTLTEMGYVVENKIIVYINETITPEFI